MPLFVSETKELVHLLLILLVNAENKVNPMSQVFGHVTRLKVLSHNAHKVVVVSGPLWDEHLIDLVIIASSSFFLILLPA